MNHQTVPGNEFLGQMIPQNWIAKEEDKVWGQDYHKNSLMTEVWDEKMSQQQLK